MTNASSRQLQGIANGDKAPDEPSTRVSARAHNRRARRLLHFGEAYALLGLTLGLILLFSILPASSGTFATVANLKLVLASQSVLCVISLAVLIPVVTNLWDFTPGATAGLAAILSASVATTGASIAVIILVAIGTGLVIGLVNGILITTTKINSVIATFGVTILISGVVQWKTEGNSIVEGIPSGLINFGRSEFLSIPLICWSAIGLSFAVYYLLRHTPYGRRLYAIGSSQQAASLVGIRVQLLCASTYVIGGALGGLAGVLLLARTGAGNPTVGPGFTLPAYAAVFLGASAVTPGRWNVGGVLIAIAFLGVLNSGLQLSGADVYINTMANGVALLGGVGISNLIARRHGRKLTLG
jgi:ribose transport system permease protein